MVHVQEAQAEVLGLGLELGAAAGQNRKYAEDLQRVQAQLSDQTQQALLVAEEAARLKAELAEAKAKSALNLEVGLVCQYIRICPRHTANCPPICIFCMVGVHSNISMFEASSVAPAYARQKDAQMQCSHHDLG